MDGALIGIIGGVVVGIIFGLCLAASDSDKVVSLNSCRAANPGYDCHIGWVRADAFK